MKFGTINRVLRYFGLVLVIAYDVDGVEPACIWLELARHYDARCL